MKLKVEDLDDPSRFRHLFTLSYSEIVPFVVDYIRRRSAVTLFFWAATLTFLGIAIVIRINIAGYFELKRIFLHTLLGTIIFPVAVIPVHELLHALPFLLSGAKKIRAGMDLKQFIFFITVHRTVITPGTFKTVALVPFAVSVITIPVLIFLLPGIWKWSLSLLLFVHSTMCAGDFAMLNYYYLNRHRKIFSWDDADRREAYFFEEL